MRRLQITICGCGNGAHACAALLSRKGHEVTLYSPLTGEIAAVKKNYEENQGLDAVIVGDAARGLPIRRITAEPSEALPQADIIFIIVPAFAHENVLWHIRKYRSADSLAVILPCRGMIELDIRKSLADANVMAFQTLPWSCRVITPGKLVHIKGIKEKIQAASFPSHLSELFFSQMEELLEMKIERIRNPLTLTLANIGQIFHPGIMYGLFKDRPDGTFQKEDIPLFYQGVTEETAAVLSGLSDEIQSIGRELTSFIPDIEMEKVLTPVQWLNDSYRRVIGDTSSLSRMLQTNQAYEGIRAPAVAAGDHLFKGDFHSRYITEDIPYSLLVTRTLGQMIHVNTPVMDQVIEALGKWSGIPFLKNSQTAADFAGKTRLPVFYGIRSVQELGERLREPG